MIIFTKRILKNGQNSIKNVGKITKKKQLLYLPKKVQLVIFLNKGEFKKVGKFVKIEKNTFFK